jgi:hypothetical protein
MDPEGADAAITALCEDAVERGILEHAGVDDSSRIVYRSLSQPGESRQRRDRSLRIVPVT